MVRQSPSLALGFLACRVGCWTRWPRNPCHRSLWSDETRVVSRLLPKVWVWKWKAGDAVPRRCSRKPGKGVGNRQACSFPGRLWHGLHKVSVGPPRQFFFSPYGPENFHLTPHCQAREEMETGLPPGRRLGVSGKQGALWNSLVRLEGAGEATVLLLPQQRPLVQTEAGAREKRRGGEWRG